MLSLNNHKKTTIGNQMCKLGNRDWWKLYILVSSPCQRQCELLSSLGICRLSRSCISLKCGKSYSCHNIAAEVLFLCCTTITHLFTLENWFDIPLLFFFFMEMGWGWWWENCLFLEKALKQNKTCQWIYMYSIIVNIS